MEEENKDMRIEVAFKTPNYGTVGCLIKIVDGGAIATFSDTRLARDMYNAEKKLGNKNQTYNERLKSIIEKYPGKKRTEIAEELVTKFKEHNVKIMEKK